jgi:hypothetical protein
VEGSAATTRNAFMGDGSIGNARNDDTSANAEFSMTHARCLGVGNGLESANGSATTNTNTPPTTPARRMAQLEIRSAQWAGAFISNRVLSSKTPTIVPGPGAKSHHSGQNATNVVTNVIRAQG